MDNLLLCSGTANRALSAKIASSLQTALAAVHISRFADSETRVVVLDDVHGKDVFIIQPTCKPVNDNIMELCLLADTLQRSGAARITAVIPYFGYARQLAARAIATMLAAVKISAVITVDLHSEQIKDYFEIPLINLHAASLLLQDPILQQLQNPVIVAPDFGALPRAKMFAQSYANAEIAVVEKQRDGNGNKAVNIFGNVSNRNCVIIDDLIDTGSTIANATRVLRAYGASQVYACVTHGVFSTEAQAHLARAALDYLLCSDSISYTAGSQVSLAPLLATTIHALHRQEFPNDK